MGSEIGSDFTRKNPEMFVITALVIALASFAIAATFAAVARDGYGQIPTRFSQF
jgi:multisubunit Na+/H+ antiporter MnhC subunit